MIKKMAKDAKQAAYELAHCNVLKKNYALEILAEMLEKQASSIMKANIKDIAAARSNNLNDALIDRLLMNPERICYLANDIIKIKDLPDPVGQILDERVVETGLKLHRRRVPLGVIGVIYEARPNVTVDITSLCLKTGNAAILRGGKETINTNLALIAIIQKTLKIANLPTNSIQAIIDPNREYIMQLLKLDKYIDMLIPRGGETLHKICRENSTIPVISGGIGVCHIFVDESADLEEIFDIIVNSKTQRPSTCNTTETLLIHRNIAKLLLPKLSEIMAKQGVTLHADKEALSLLASGPAIVLPVSDEKLRKEWLSLDLNVVIVNDIYHAVEHIRKYGSAHSDAILTQRSDHADKFIQLVDSAVVYVNASTRFTDGVQFGLGAEVAVSTQKLHARGPMGLEALTTYKWVGIGENSCRI